MTFVKVGRETLTEQRRLSAQAATPSDAPNPTEPYRLTIAQKFPPHHAIVCSLHDKPPTPSEGGGGWEEVKMPRRPAVLIWTGRGLMKLSLSVVFDNFIADQTVLDSNLRTLLRFWRPEGSKNSDTVEPSVLKLASVGDIVPYTNLSWIISDLGWGAAQGNASGARTQQILDLEFTEFRADERLVPISQKKKKRRTEPHKVKKGETLGSIARKHGITAKELGAMQHPPIKDSRKIEPGQTILVPVGK